MTGRPRESESVATAADRVPSTFMLAASKALVILAPLADQIYRDAKD